MGFYDNYTTLKRIQDEASMVSKLEAENYKDIPIIKEVGKVVLSDTDFAICEAILELKEVFR